MELVFGSLQCSKLCGMRARLERATIATRPADRTLVASASAAAAAAAQFAHSLLLHSCSSGSLSACFFPPTLLRSVWPPTLILSCDVVVVVVVAVAVVAAVDACLCAVSAAGVAVVASASASSAASAAAAALTN